MPSNEQRRDAAKRKLERQLERRAHQDRRRRQLTIVGVVVAGLVVVAAVVGVLVWKSDDNTNATGSTTPSDTDAMTTSPNTPGVLPTLKALPATVNCAYDHEPPPEPGRPTPPNPKKATPPTHTRNLPTKGDANHSATASVSISTNQGNIGLTLSPAEAPCTVNSFASLAGQGYFNGTKCHRLTTEGIKVLQCGDPTGTGGGTPGYRFADEYPTDQYAADDPGLQGAVVYPRGTVAMANSGANTNGSQFFLVYGDSPLPPNYTIFGTIDATGLKTLDKIAAGGVVPAADGSSGDGAPKLPVEITSVGLDN